MRHPTLFVTLSAGLILLSSCTQSGVAADPSPEPGLTFDANTMVEMRLSTLQEPMVWGGRFTEPGMDSILPGSVVRDTTGSTGVAACADPQNWYAYVNYAPLYQDAEVFLERIRSMDQEVKLLNPGKLMVLGNWKFVTDVNRGIHIYDDTNPVSPVKVAFLHVPGVLDIALKNKVLYANAFSALIAIDIENPRQARAIHMIPDAFPPVYSWGGPVMDSLGNVAVAWRADTVYTCSYIDWRGEEVMYDGAIGVPDSGVKDAESGAPSLGQNASLSRFAISADWLYTVDYSALRLFDIRSERSPKKGAVVETGAWDLETIFRYEDGLFLGSMTGMLIYDHSQGGTPVQASIYSHITSCDPVVVQDDIAYVTLRSGQRCANGKNELNVIDVSDIYKPALLAAYPMKNPAGLAVEDSTLFVCEGEYGLAVLDIQNPQLPREVSRLESVQPEDIIARNGILTLIGPSGIWRVDYSDRENLQQLSFTEAEGEPVVQPSSPGVLLD